MLLYRKMGYTKREGCLMEFSFLILFSFGSFLEYQGICVDKQLLLEKRVKLGMK